MLSAVPYLLPLFDGIRYSKYLMVAYPAIFRLIGPLIPFMGLYYSIPLAPLIAFFGIYFGITRNMNLPRYVRYNAMQAVILDIVLIVPQIFEQAFGGLGPVLGGVGEELKIIFYNTMFLFVFLCFAYGVGSALTGQTARLPLVADAADQQVPM